MSEKIYTQYVSEFGMVREIEMPESEAKEQIKRLREQILKVDKVRENMGASNGS